MKERIRTLLVGIALISLLLLAAGDVLAKRHAKKGPIFFSGNTYADFAVFADWGEYMCPGGESSGLPYGPPMAGGTLAPCSPGSNFHMRDREMVFNVEDIQPTEVAPLVEGLQTLLVNWNWRYEAASADETEHLYSGPMWGTFKVVLDDGTWEGTMTGNWDGVNRTANWNFVGHGNGGDINGMQIKIEFAGGAWGGPIQGRILRPGSDLE